MMMVKTYNEREEIDVDKILDAQEMISSGVIEYRLATKLGKLIEPIRKIFGIQISVEDAIRKLAIGREMLIDILSEFPSPEK